MHRPLIIIVGLIVLSGIGLASPAGQNQIMCRVLLHRTTAFHDMHFQVPVRYQSALLRDLERFAAEHNMIYAAHQYPPGVVDFEHRSYMIQLCDRHLNILVSNAFEAEDFALRIAHFDDQPSAEAARVSAAIIRRTPETVSPTAVELVNCKLPIIVARIRSS